MSETTWRTCPGCPEDDNQWPEEAFRYAGGTKTGLCNDCYLTKYPARRVDCSGCGKRMKTRGKCKPRCRVCRRAEGPPPPPLCINCGGDCTSKTMVGDECYACYLRVYRAENGRRVA